jgi:DNA-directed RNA polymerase subunit K/omega
MNRFHLLCVIAKKAEQLAPKTHSIAEVGCERNVAAECGCP